MKWIVVLLVLLNAAYFGYEYFMGEPVINQPITRSDNSQLKLLSEADEPVKQSAQKSKVANTSKVLNKPSSADDVVVQKFISCVTLGDNTSREPIEQLLKTLPDDFAAEVMRYTLPGPAMYRVYVPPLDDKTAVVKAIRKLESNGFNDHYVMSLEGKPFAIALGVFSKRSSAEGIAEQVKQLSMEAEVVEVEPIDETTLYALRVKGVISQQELMAEVAELAPAQKESIKACKEED